MRYFYTFLIGSLLLAACVPQSGKPATDGVVSSASTSPSFATSLYMHETEGFSFEYPSTWEVSDDTGDLMLQIAPKGLNKEMPYQVITLDYCGMNCGWDDTCQGTIEEIPELPGYTACHWISEHDNSENWKGIRKTVGGKERLIHADMNRLSVDRHEFLAVLRNIVETLTTIK